MRGLSDKNGEFTTNTGATPRHLAFCTGPNNASKLSSDTQNGMRTSSLPWETWRALITALREKAPPYMHEYADHVEQHAPSQLTVRLSVTHDVSCRCVTLAAVSL